MGALKQFQDAVNAAALRSEQMRQSGGDAVANQVGEKAVADLNRLRLQLFTDQVLPKLKQAKVNQATIDSALYQWEAQTVRMLGDAGFMPTMKEMEDSKGAGSVSMLGRRRQYADDLDLARLNQQGLAGQATIKARALTRAAKAPGEILSSGLSQAGSFFANVANDGLNFVRRQFDPDRTAEQDKQTDLGRAARRMAEESRQKAERGGAGSVQSDNTVLGDLWQNTHDISTSLLQSTPGMVLGMGVGGGTSLGLRALGAGRSAQVVGGALAGVATEFPQNYGDAKTSTIATLNERDQSGKRLISNAQMAANIPYFRKVRDAQIANGIDPQQADEIAREATVERLSQKAAVSGAAVAQLISLIGPGAGGYAAKRLSARQAASNSRAIRLAERLMGLDDIPLTAQRASQAVNRTTFTGLGLGTEASRAVKREAAEEAGQEFAMNVARENARATASGENFNWGNTTQNLASSAIAGGVMGGAMHMSTHGTQQQMDRRQINAMASQTQALEASMAQNQAGIQAIQQRAAAAGGQLSPAQQDELQARMDDHQQMQQAYQAHVANMQQLGLNPYGGVLSAGAPAAQGQAGTAAPAAPSAAPVQQPAPAAPTAPAATLPQGTPPAPPQQPPATAPAPQQPPAAQAPAPTPAPAPAQQPGQPAPAATAPAQQGPKPPRWNVMGLNNLGGETVLMVDDGGVITHRPVSDLDSMEQEGLTFSSPDVEQQVNALRQGGVVSPQAQQSGQPSTQQQPDPQQQPAPQQNQADQFPDFVNAELARNGFGPSAPAPVAPPPEPPKPGLAGIAERAAQRNTPSAIETPENIQAMADYNQQMLNQAQQPKPPRWNVLGVTDLNGTPVVMVDDGGLMVHRSVSDLDAMQKEGMTFSSPGVEQQVNALRQGIAPAAPAPAPAPDQSQTVASPAPAQVTAPATAAKQAPAKPKKPRQPKAQKPADAAPAQPEQIAEPSTPAEAVQPTKPEPAKAAQAQAPSTATPGTQQGDITRADGKPFANANAARLQIGKRGLKDSHEVVEVGPSAFVVRPRQQGQDDAKVQPAVPPAEAAPATAKAGTYEDALKQGHKNPERIKESDLTDEQWDAAHAEAQRLMDEGGTVKPKEQPEPAPAKPEAAEPFEHVGLKISPYRHRAGGEIKDGWLVQTPENAEREARGERQIGGDRILDSREAAIRAAEQMASLYQENKAYRAGFEQKEQDAKAAEAARKEANRGKTLVERRADAVLDKPTNIPSNFNLGNGTRREAMQRAVDQGHLIEMAMVHDSAAKKRDEGVMASVRKSGYMLGLSNPNIPLVKAGLEAQARLKENKYEKPEYRVYDGPSSEGLFVEISKTEYDYAQHLKTRFEQSNSAAEQVKPEAQQATPTEQAQRQDDQAGAPEQAVSGDANVIHVEPEGDAKGTQSEVKQSAKTARRNLTSADYRAMREQIIADVKKAISAAPDEATDERIVFDVEGDGRFSVRNNKEALREFLKKVEVGFTVGTTNRAPSKNSWTSAKTSATQTEAISAIRRFLSEPDEYTTLNVYGIAIEQNLPVIFTKIRTNKGRSPSVSAVVISETRTIGDQSFHFGHVVNDSGAPAVNLTGRAVLVLDSGEIVKESKPTEKPQVMFAEVEKAAKDQNSPFKKNLAIVTERHGELPSQADLKAQFEQQIGFDTFDAPATPAPKVDAPAQTEAGKQAERRMANLRKQASGRNLTPGQRQRLEQKINQAQQEKEAAESKPKPAAGTGGVDAVRAKQGVAPDARATEQPVNPVTQPSVAQPNPSGRYTEDSPILTQAEAKELLEWQNMGQSDGVKTHRLFFYESKANKDAKTGRMEYGTVESYQGGKWSFDDRTYSSLSAAKTAAVELAIARLKVDGFVKMTEVEKILGVDAVNRPANKAAKLRKESERLAKEAHKMLDRIEPGQPVLSTRDRNLRERSMEKMRKAAELNAQADALEGAKPLSPEAMRERLQETSSDELKAVFDMLGLAGSLLTHRELVNALLAEDAQEVSDALDRAVADRKNPSPAPAKESAAPAQKPVVEHDGQAAEVKQPSATGIDWDATDQEQRTKILVLPGGWSTAKGGLNFVGKRLLKESWAEIHPAIRAKIERLSQKLEAADAPPASKTPLLDKHNSFTKDILQKGKATVEQYQAAFADLVANKDAIFAELGTKTKAQLLEMGGTWFAAKEKNETKPEIIKSLYQDMMQQFTIGRALSYMMGRRWEDALQKMVDNTSQSDLDAYAKEISDLQAKYDQQWQQTIKALENPETYDELVRKLKMETADGKNFKEAYLALTPEQRAVYDRGHAAQQERELAARAAQEQPKTAQYSGPTTQARIQQTKHTKHGHDLWVVTLADRLDRADYDKANADAKKLGGSYSSYRGGGAIPGFQFRTPEAAQAFADLMGGNKQTADQQMQDRQDALQDDSSQSGVERLKSIADRLQEKAGEILGASRNVNTARRARMAGYAVAEGRKLEARAKTVRALISQIEAGEVSPYLSRIRANTQLEFLDGLVSVALRDHLSQSPKDFSGKNWSEAEAVPDTASHAEMPKYTMDVSEWIALANRLDDQPGTTKMVQAIRNMTDDNVSDDYLKFAKDNLYKVLLSKQGGQEAAIFKGSRDNLERAVRRHPERDNVMLLQIKRGEFAIVLSPKAAKERGIWEVNPGKRVAVKADFGASLVAKLKELKIEVPHALSYADDRLQKLQRLGIQTSAQLRDALREYIKLKAPVQEEDAVSRLQRELSAEGRQNDGLDFFPTAPAVIDQMLEAANLEAGMRVLEPSAGMGHIADRVRGEGIEPEVIEFSPKRRELLEAKGFEVVGHDFMEAKADEGGYDRILMNPPFGNRRDAQHVQHAYDLLKPGGRIVAIMGEGVFFGQDAKAKAFRDWLDAVGGTSEQLPEGSFQDPSLPVTTGVNARLVVIDKPDNGAADSGIRFSRRAGGEAEAQRQFAETEKVYGGQAAYERAKADGQTKLDYRQWIQVRTPNFKAWFGDWEADPANASKVVDPNTGEPMVVYHGTRSEEFTQFNEKHGGIYLTQDLADAEAIFTQHGQGDALHLWANARNPFDARWRSMTPSQKEWLRKRVNALFSPEEVEAAAAVMDVAVEDAEPFEVFTDGEIYHFYGRQGQNDVIEMLRKAGHDAVIFPDHLSLGEPHVSVVVFDSTQIKSATDNTGEFSADNPDIRHSQPTATPTGMTVAKVRALLAKKIGKAALEALEKAGRLEVIQTFDPMKSAGDLMRSVMAWHGSPFKFDRFSLEHLGRGEGSQAFGWGLYFADSRGVAEWYRETLTPLAYKGRPLTSDLVEETRKTGDEWAWRGLHEVDQYGDVDTAIANLNKFIGLNDIAEKVIHWLKANRNDFAKSSGQLYQVRLPAEDDYLLWDKPLSEQSNKVWNAIGNKATVAVINHYGKQNQSLFKYLGQQELTGMDLYRALTDKLGSDKAASEYLHRLGISGIKYLDGTSRDAGEGSHNYVVFDDSAVQVLETYYSRLDDQPEGFYDPSTGKATLVADALTEETVIPTLLHELSGHRGFQELMKSSTYQAILAQVKRMVQQGNPIAVAAWERAQVESDAQTREAELLPYLITEAQLRQQGRSPAMQAVQRLIDQTIRAIKTWAAERGFGPAIRNLSADDIRVLAEKMLKREASRPDPQGPKRSKASQQFSQIDSPRSELAAVRRQHEGKPTWMKAPNGKPTKLTERQWLQVRTPRFKKWFGDWEGDPANASKVVDENGEPMVVYHGTHASFTTFRPNHDLGGLMFFASSPAEASNFSYAAGASVMPVFLRATNPAEGVVRSHSEVEAAEQAKKDGNDAIRVVDSWADIDTPNWAVFDPTQIKSAIGNTGEFSADNPDIRYSRPTPSNHPLPPNYTMARYVARAFGRGTSQSIGTMLHNALQNQEFRKVFDLQQAKLNQVNADAFDSIDAAPGLLDRLENFEDVKRMSRQLVPEIGRRTTANGRDVPTLQMRDMADIKAAAEAIFDGTLMHKTVFTDTELRSIFGLTDKQIGFYRSARKAIEISLNHAARSSLLHIGRDSGIPFDLIYEELVKNSSLGEVETFVRDHLDAELARAKAIYPANSDELQQAMDVDDKARQQMADVLDKLQKLLNEGYAPLMRFGDWYLTVLDDNGDTVLHERFESERQRNRAHTALINSGTVPDNFSIVTGRDNPKEYQLYQKGVNAEAIALFAKEAGIPLNDHQQAYYKLATSNHSALRRLIHRKGIPGFSDNLPRVLASFVMSSARHSANTLFGSSTSGPLQEALAKMRNGDENWQLKAQEMVQYADDPKEEPLSMKIRQLLFLKNMGGSVAFGVVNLMQPLQQTMPFLAREHGAKAVPLILQGIGRAMSFKIPAEFQQEYDRARREGHLDPASAWSLQGLERGSGGIANSYWGVMNHALGAVAEVTETVNRRATLFAALEGAKSMTQQQLDRYGSAYNYAIQAIQETQGVMNKGNRPKWARGTAGSLLMVYKQFGIAYVEQLIRSIKNPMWRGQRDKWRRSMWMMLMMLWALAGSVGLPFAQNIADTVKGTLSVAGHPVQLDREFEKLVGNEAADFILNGAWNYANLGVDLQGRTSMGSLIPGTQLMDPSITDQSKQRAIAGFGGASGGMVSDILDAFKNTFEGKSVEAAINLAPRSIGSMIKAGQMYTTGKFTDSRGRLISDDVTMADVLIKALDGQPARLADIQRSRGMESQADALQASQRRKFKARIVEAVEKKDKEALREALADLDQWNKTRKEYPVKITRNEIKQALKKRQQDWTQRSPVRPETLKRMADSM